MLVGWGVHRKHRERLRQLPHALRPRCRTFAARAEAQLAGHNDAYRLRAATAECGNALTRNCWLKGMSVHGLRKVRAVAYLCALVHNLMRLAKVAPQRVGRGTGASAIAAAPA